MAVLGTTDMGRGARTLLVDHDPFVVATDAPTGALIVREGSSTWYRKLDDGLTTNVAIDEVPSAAAKLEYGSFCVARANQDSWNQTTLREWIYYHAADIKRNVSSYFGSCFFDVVELDDSSVYSTWEKLQFADVAAMYTFIRDNFAESISNPGTPARHAYVRVYDMVGPQVPNIDKIYGINKFYSVLRGSKNYRSNPYCLTSTPSWDFFAPWFNDLCNQNFGFGSGHTYSAGDESALWLSRNERKRYGLPHPGFSSYLQSNVDRAIWNWGDSSFSSLPTPTRYDNDPAPNGSRHTYCGLHTQAISSWEWVDNGPSLGLGIGSMDRSWLALYHLQSGIDSNHRAIMLKPVGIDQAGLNWFDSSSYDICALYTRKNSTPIMRQLSLAGSRVSTVRDLVWLDITQWRPPNHGRSPSDLSMNMVGEQPYITQFMLRDKVTREVSPASKPRIVLSQRHRDAPYKYEVKRP